MITIDVTGKPCPIPVIEAKKALSAGDCEGVVVRVDNIIAVQNLEKMAKGEGFKFSYISSAPDLYDAEILKSDKAAAAGTGKSSTVTDSKPAPQAVCAAPCGTVVVFGSDSLGSGDSELGKILIKGFVYSLAELTVPPVGMIFFNSGVKLTTGGANTVADITRLQEKGTKILTCGTCVNHYGIADKLAVGSIANMYEITELMTCGAVVINI